MKLTVRLFAGLAETIGHSEVIVNIESSIIKVGELKEYLINQYPQAKDSIAISFIAKNQAYASADDTIEEADELALIPPVSGGEEADLKADSRYSRQTLFSPIGVAGQLKLKHSRVAIVGMGALGTVLANHMVRAGIGYIRIIDRDFVEWSNLQRQMLFEEHDAEVSAPKAIAAANRLRLINSAIEIEPHVTDLNATNAEKLLGDVDLILDGSTSVSSMIYLGFMEVLLALEGFP
jgi:molybdopterin converting factor subunit 1